VGDAHGRIGGVDVLAAGAGGPVGVDAAIALVDLDLDAVVDHRIDPGDGNEVWRRALAVIGRDAHQPVDARFGLQPAIGVVALDQQGGRLDAGLFAVVDFHDLDLEAVLFGPAACTCAAASTPSPGSRCRRRRSGFPEGVVGIGLAGQQRFDCSLSILVLEAAQLRFRRPRTTFPVAFHLAQFDQLDVVGKVCSSLLDAADAVESCWRSRISFCALVGSFQRSRILGAGVQFFQVV
jgi:hypothetical protein